MKKTYPMTPEQEATAQRRGWHQPLKNGKWSKPKNFSETDQERIDQAEARRVRRGRRD